MDSAGLELGNHQHFKDLCNFKKTFVVLVYMDTCKPCQRLKPALLKRASHDNIPVYMIHKGTDPKLDSELEVQKVPHLVSFRDGEFRGHIQNSDILVSWPFIKDSMMDLNLEDEDF